MNCSMYLKPEMCENVHVWQIFSFISDQVWHVIFLNVDTMYFLQSAKGALFDFPTINTSMFKQFIYVWQLTYQKFLLPKCCKTYCLFCGRYQIQQWPCIVTLHNRGKALQHLVIKCVPEKHKFWLADTFNLINTHSQGVKLPMNAGKMYVYW